MNDLAFVARSDLLVAGAERGCSAAGARSCEGFARPREHVDIDLLYPARTALADRAELDW